MVLRHLSSRSVASWQSLYQGSEEKARTDDCQLKKRWPQASFMASQYILWSLVRATLPIVTEARNERREYFTSLNSRIEFLQKPLRGSHKSSAFTLGGKLIFESSFCHSLQACIESIWRAHKVNPDPRVRHYSVMLAPQVPSRVVHLE